VKELGTRPTAETKLKENPMKNEKTKKLVLSRTMIRNLTTKDLSLVAGGTDDPTRTLTIQITCPSLGCDELNPQPLPP
jgi:hypothetical protein